MPNNSRAISNATWTRSLGHPVETLTLLPEGAPQYRAPRYIVNGTILSDKSCPILHIPFN